MKKWTKNEKLCQIQYKYLTNKEASTVLCSVVKHAGSGRARKKCRGIHFLSALTLPKCFTTEQSTVEASLFVKYLYCI